MPKQVDQNHKDIVVNLKTPKEEVALTVQVPMKFNLLHVAKLTVIDGGECVKVVGSRSQIRSYHVTQCESCGKSADRAVRGNARYCSNACRQRSYRKRKRGRS